MRKVYRLIRQLGMTSKYKGYYYVAEAVMMSMELQDYPIKITKDIYPYLAKKFKSTPVNIEHDIRTVINVCWTANKETMDRIAGYPLRYRPTNSEFVDMLAYYLIQTELDAEDAIEEAKKVLESQGAKYRNLSLTSDSDAGKYASNIMSFPATVLVDRNGNIIGEQFMGGVDNQENYDALMKQIQAVIDADSAK